MCSTQHGTIVFASLWAKAESLTGRPFDKSPYWLVGRSSKEKVWLSYIRNAIRASAPVRMFLLSGLLR